ncbi:MAG: GNAT family N-acetyltransferase [Anaerolineales bacterium]|jgi:ribosomal protein S18 acetylase RimI-like enzyme
MADKEFEFQYVENPEESAWGIIGRGVASFNRQQAGENNFQRLCYVVQAPDQEIVGGVLGETYFDWLFIELLWVKEEFRGRGYGHHLLRLAEELARERGAKNVYLDTFSFQAPEFYKKRGYQVFGELAEFPPGHRRLFLTKPL